MAAFYQYMYDPESDSFYFLGPHGDRHDISDDDSDDDDDESMLTSSSVSVPYMATPSDEDDENTDADDDDENTDADNDVDGRLAHWVIGPSGRWMRLARQSPIPPPPPRGQ